MKKISVDSCVFFNMIGLNQKYKNFGFEKLKEIAESDKRDLVESEKLIRGILAERIVNEINKTDFLEFYGDYVTKLGNYVGSGKKTPEEKAEVAILIDEVTKKYAYLIPENKKNASAEKQYCAILWHFIEEYKEIKDLYYANLLLQQSIKGEIELYLTSNSYLEIKAHIKDFKPKNVDEDFLLFEKEEVEDLTETQFTMLNVDKTISDDVYEIAKEFRTLYPEEDSKTHTAMKDSKNILDEYGDSLIMAGSNLAGISVVTLNIKDFIDPSGSKGLGKYISSHLSYVAQKDDRLTNALAYSIEDVVCGNYNQPEQHSRIVQIKSAEKSNEVKFKKEEIMYKDEEDEYEIE